MMVSEYDLVLSALVSFFGGVMTGRPTPKSPRQFLSDIAYASFWTLFFFAMAVSVNWLF